MISLKKKNMERTCEFCMDLRPVVYCKADDALFCLPCDAKVHSANALFNRHLRTILCDSCRYRPAYAQCLDHRMLMCRSCDRSLHGVSSEHQKQLVGSYLGCPSAKDFAALWGYGCAELDRILVRNQQFSNSCASTQSGVPNFDIVGESWPQSGTSSKASNASCSTFTSGAESGFALRGQQMEISHKGQQQQNACFIQEQILDLQKFQVTSPTVGAQEQTSTFSTSFDKGKKIDYDLEGSQNYQNLVTGVQQSDYPTQELKANSLPVPFSQPEQLPFSSTAGDAWLGDTYWQCKSPVQSSQLWSQNMQDLGVCEDTISRDDFNIPDVDITFQNFEELFGGDQDPMRALADHKLMSCSSIEKDMSLENSCNGSARAMEDACASQFVPEGQDSPQTVQTSYSTISFTASRQSARASQFVPEGLDSPRTVQTSYSTISFTASRQSAESSCGEYLENGLSSYVTKEDAASSHSPDRDFAHPEARENAMMRYKEKKKARMLEKQNRYPARKPRSVARRRGSG